ncbi:hypothetical protein [Clostridium intestinale]|uniref:Uncharacterized protein n=1 Tax=Clostridium intestinale URNW TaxID=1294142 RepID=U2Q3K2_9CLOT|nr:hypothetical protein [Clostridium intestinale]ERK30649.1 hypothetical protein CINTURNW_2269 [Clostridium intestinale URNW]
MAVAGNTYIKSLKPSHLRWGTYRNTTTRTRISGEGYIPLPKRYARSFNVFNSNNSNTGFGYNLFRASSADGFLNNVTLLAQGCSRAGDFYAKQFSVQGNLTMIGAWYASQNATTNNSVRVTWVSSTEILLEII